MNNINYMILFMSGCSVLRMNEVLPQGVGGFKVDQGVIIIKDPPECLRCSCDIRNDYVVYNSSALSILYKDSPTLYKDSPTLYKDSPTLYKDSPTLYKDSPTLYKKTPTINKGQSHTI